MNWTNLAVVAVLIATAFADEINLVVRKSIQVEFQTQPGKNYQLFSAPNVEATYQPLGEPLAGTGGRVTLFYNTEVDQKVFFKVGEATAGPVPSLHQLSRLDLNGADLTGRVLTSESFVRADLRDAILRNADLRGVNFDRANLRWTDFTGADLRGASLRGVYLLKNNFANADLRGVDFFFAGFVEGPFNFKEANFEGSDLTHNFLMRSDFTGANFSGARLRSTSMQDSVFRGADLTGADFAFANLSRADLTGAKGFDASRPGTIFDATIMPDGSTRSGINPGDDFVPAGITTATLHVILLDGPDRGEFDLRIATGPNASFQLSNGLDYQGSASVFPDSPNSIFVQLMHPVFNRSVYLAFDSADTGRAYFSTIEVERQESRFSMGTFSRFQVAP